MSFDISRRERRLGRAATGAAKIRWPLVVVSAFSILCSATLVVVISPGAAWADAAALVVQGHIQAVAASEAGVVAVSDHVVRILDARGYPKRTLWPPADPPPHIRRAAPRDEFASLPGLTGDSDWTDPIDPDVLDDPDDPRIADEIQALDIDENRQRAKPRPPSRQPRSEVLAVTGTKAWVGRPDGLWRVDLDDGPAVRTLNTGSGIDAVASTAGPAGETVAIVSRRHLSRSRDGGESFESATALESAPRALAVTADGTLYVVDDDGLQVAPPDRSDLERVALMGAIDVASCGREVIVLAGTEVFTVMRSAEGKRVDRIGVAPTGSRRILCGSDEPIWVAYGEGLWTSDDRGASWRARSDLQSGPILGVSMTRTALWVATSSGLWRLAPFAAEADVPSPSPHPNLRVSSDPGRTFTQAGRWWTSALPHVDISLIAARTASRRDLRALIVLTFILDRSTSAPLRDAASAADLWRKRIAIDAASAAYPAESKLSTDPVAADERRALALALEDRL